MTVKSWQPTPSSDRFSIDEQVLRDFLKLSQSGNLQRLDEQLSAHVKRDQRALMTIGREAWTAAAEAFSNDELVHLVKFFTLAEQQLEGWEAAELSPVVWLVKVLRRRKAPPDKELLLWIKSNSNNRFLPNGAL